MSAYKTEWTNPDKALKMLKEAYPYAKPEVLQYCLGIYIKTESMPKKDKRKFYDDLRAAISKDSTE